MFSLQLRFPIGPFLGYGRFTRRPVAYGPADAADREQDRYTEDRGDQEPALVPPGELLQAIGRRRWAGDDCFVIQVVLDIRRETVGRLVAAVAVLFEGLHHDPVQLAADELGEFRRFCTAVGSQR